MAQNEGEHGDSGEPNMTKRKVMSNNLLNMKFMQRGRDAEVAIKLQQQQIKEVSDQQWHLSVVREVDSVKTKSPRTVVSYEPSYISFEGIGGQERGEEQVTNRGRKIFGSFVPDIDQELIRSARDGQTKDASGLDASSENQNDGTTTGRPIWPKRPRGEDASAGGNRKHKKLKKKNERDI